MNPAYVGTIAAVCSIASFVPQAWRIVKTQDTEGLSRSMWILNTIGFAVWVSYGVLLKNLPIIVPNVICFLLAAFILTRVLRSRRTSST